MDTMRNALGATAVMLALLLAAAPASGQDVARQEARRAARVERQAARREAALKRMAERLELNDDQKAAVGEVMRVNGETGQRGDGWMLAAVLDRELSEEQLSRLFDASRDAVAYRRGVADGLRRGAVARGARSMRRGGAAGSAPVAQRQAAIESMQKALGLSDRQVRILRIHDALAGIFGARVQARVARLQGLRSTGPARRRGR